MVDEAQLCSEILSILKHQLCDMQLGVVMEKNWAHYVDQCRVQSLQLLVHLINVLSILLRYKVSLGIRKL